MYKTSSLKYKKAKYKNLCKKICKLTSVCKNDFYANEFQKATGDTKKEWKLINNILNRNLQKNSIPELEVNGISYAKPDDKANLFNEYFSTISKEAIISNVLDSFL